MKIELNFDEISIADWCDLSDYENPQVPTLKEVFKQEILEKFIEKVNWDRDIRQYIKRQIEDGLWSKIKNYKNKAAIEVIVKDIIKEEMKQTGSFIFLDIYAKDVHKEVEKYLESYKKEIKTAVETSMRSIIKSQIDDLYKADTLMEFIDKEKLSAFLLEKIKEEGILK